MEHIVQFDEYCNKCEYYARSESEDPCWECLDNPINEDSRRPINYKEKKSKRRRRKENNNENQAVHNS